MVSPLPALRPLAAALSETAAALAPRPVETVPIAEAIGGVLAEPLVIPAPVPAAARALRAGYAVASRDLVGVSAYAPLPVPEPPFVAAGDPLPTGCDAVVPPDGIGRSGPLVEIVASVSPGENARRAGEDGAAGQVLAGAGTVLRPLAAAAALAAGLRQAAIRRCVCHVVTVADSAEALAVPDLPGLRVVHETIASPEAWTRVLATSEAAILLAVADAGPDLAAAPARLVAPGLALRPGETAQVALLGRLVVITVPQRLDAVFAVARCLVAPLVVHLTGAAPSPRRLRGLLTRKLTSTVGFTEIALLRETPDGLELLALGTFGLAALAQADGWLAIPPESEGLQAGEVVEAHPV